MTTAVRPLPDHGTEARYQGSSLRPGCKCQTCVRGWTKAHQRRALARLEGRPPKVPAGPITAHINNLISNNMSARQIADVARVNRNTIVEHSRGHFSTIRRTVAARILAVRPTHLAEAGWVDATGTRRRLQALYAIGHGCYRIADASPEINDRTIDYILRGKRTQVTVATRDAVTAVYAQLATQPGGGTRARNRATAEGWPDPTFWEDYGHIDDRTFDPASVERELKRDELAAIRRDEIALLHSACLTDEEIATRVGVAPSTVHGVRAELRTGARRDRRKQVAA